MKKLFLLIIIIAAAITATAQDCDHYEIRELPTDYPRVSKAIYSKGVFTLIRKGGEDVQFALGFKTSDDWDMHIFETLSWVGDTIVIDIRKKDITSHSKGYEFFEKEKKFTWSKKWKIKSVHFIGPTVCDHKLGLKFYRSGSDSWIVDQTK